LLEGRDFDAHDSEEAEPVVIISRTLAQRIRAAGYSPLGYRLRLGLSGPGWNKIVGVCSDARYRSITQGGADIFVPYLQVSQPTNYVVIRGTESAQDLAALVRRTLAEIDPTQAVAGVATIGELIDANAARHRFNMILLLWFGLCAAILAATGVYSVIAETMVAREHEIAIRAALGAQKTRLVSDMISRTLGLVLIGETLGALVVFALGKLGAEVLYGVSARDPLVLGSVAAFLSIVSLGAAFLPAWSAAGNDLMVSLRAS
jgi:putative ABC transport system permease protein